MECVILYGHAPDDIKHLREEDFVLFKASA